MGFGRIFFDEYRFVFDLEEGKIGYYKSYSNKNHPFIILFFVVIFGLIYILGYWRGNTMKKNEANLYNNNIPNKIREEYADPIKDKILNNKKEEIKEEKRKEKKEKDKKDDKKEEKKINDKKIKKD